MSDDSPNDKYLDALFEIALHRLKVVQEQVEGLADAHATRKKRLEIGNSLKFILLKLENFLEEQSCTLTHHEEYFRLPKRDLAKGGRLL